MEFGLRISASHTYLDHMTTPVFRLSHRTVFAATGEDTLSFLNRVLTCRLDNLAVGEGSYGAFLTPQGKILSDLFAFRTSETLFLDLPSAAAEDAIKRLTMLKLRAKLSFEIRPDLMSVQTETKTLDGSLIMVQDGRFRGTVHRGIFDASAPVDGLHDADVDPRYHALRMQSGVPEFGFDFGSADVFPSDVNMDLLGGIDYRKGCFIGQEVVSRMKRKTEVRKRTLFIENLPSGAQAGDAVMAGASTLGTLTSVSDLSALALMRLDRVKTAQDDQVPVTVNETPVTVHPLRDAMNV